MKMSAREQARRLSTERLEYEIGHTRRLWGCIRDDRYDILYARILGIYRAEMRRRELADEQQRHDEIVARISNPNGPMIIAEPFLI